jgi:hypothetical protein
MTPKPRNDPAWPVLGFVLLLVGAILALDALPELWALCFYVEGRCELLDKRLVENPPRRKAINSTWRPEFLIRYEVDGKEYNAFAYRAVKSSSGWRWPEARVVERFTVGEEYPCWYDANDPSRVVLVRGFSWLTYLLLPIFCVLLFFVGKGILSQLHNSETA